MATSARGTGARLLGEVEVVSLEEVGHFEGVLLRFALLSSKSLW